MPFGISTRTYFALVCAGFGSTCLGSMCVHLMMRPDRSAPNMAPYIEAQREVIRKVQNRKKNVEERAKVKDSNGEDPMVIATQHGEYTLDQLDPQTGVPKGMKISSPTAPPSIDPPTRTTVPKFWMFVPVPKQSVADLDVDGPIIDVTEEFAQRRQ